MKIQRKSKLKGLVASSFILFLSACALGPPRPDLDYKHGYDFGNAKTVAFFEDSGLVSGDNPMQLSDIQRERINSAIRTTVENKGLSFVDDTAQADLLLSWHLNTQHQTDIHSYKVPGRYGYFGGYNRYSFYNCWSCGINETEVTSRNYTQGTFILDFIDPVAKQSVWRGVTESRLRGKQERDQVIYNEAAAAILAAYPPK